MVCRMLKVPDRPHLASDHRAGTFARQKARSAQRQYLRHHWRWLLLMYGTLAGIAYLAVAFQPNDFIRGLGCGLGLAGAAGAIVAMVIIQTGTGPTMAGDLAEQWTAQELRPLTKHRYELANHVSVDGRGDADHVLVGPGGLFVLETKWSASDWTPDGRFFDAAMAQVQARARNTGLQVKRLGVSSVTPVLVLWGRAGRELTAGPGVRRKDDVYVIAGAHLQRWLLGRALRVRVS